MINELTAAGREMYTTALVRAQAKRSSPSGYCCALGWLEVPLPGVGFDDLIGPNANDSGPTRWRNSFAALCAEATREGVDWQRYFKVRSPAAHCCA